MGGALHFTGLQHPECKAEKNGVLEATSVKSSKGEDGPVTGIQQVRPTLFYTSSRFFIITFFLMQDESIVFLTV